MEMMEITLPNQVSPCYRKKKYTQGVPRQDCDKSCNSAETARKFATILKEHQKAVDPKQSRKFGLLLNIFYVSAIRLQESSTIL